jgi:hypothetical protein
MLPTAQSAAFRTERLAERDAAAALDDRSPAQGTTFMPKPWRPLDMLREAERSLH